MDVGAGIYGKSPPARQLFIGGKTPLEVKQADRINDRDVGDAMHESFARYFDIQDTDEIRSAFYLVDCRAWKNNVGDVERGKTCGSGLP